MLEKERKMNPYQSEISEVLTHFHTRSTGLTGPEAQGLLEQHGYNRFDPPEKVSWFRRFLQQLADPMILILLCAAGVSAVTAIIEKGEGLADVFIILFVVIVNAVLGVLQESKAEKAIEALKQMNAATCKVLRNGEMAVLRTEEVVPGDILILEAGDAVPADARVIESKSLQAEESALTGESVPVNKHTDAIKAQGSVPLGDRSNMVYSGSTVVYGRGMAVVTATGMHTEMGRIAKAITQAQEGQTPLQRKLSQLSRILTVAVLGICAFIFAFSLLRANGAGGINGRVVLDTFILSVSLAVAAIPEGLAAVVTIVLSMGVTKMSKRNAVIRKLTAVETLGCTQIICSDKTGTLTQNKMTVTAHFGPETLLATGMALCSDAELDEEGKAVGEPTECALVNYAFSLSLHKKDLKQAWPRKEEAPFDSMRKMMTTIHATERGVTQFTKGAPDVVLARCTAYTDGTNVYPMDDAMREKIAGENKAMADKALRVLALACRNYDAIPTDIRPDALEQDLVFVGLTGMIDPVRPEVKAAIVRCTTAGIRPVMITGDHLDTAVAIAKELGIIQDATQAVTGSMLDGFSEEELKELVTKFSVYARVQPEHKVRIVKAWQANGKITAMTGDGVNDAPSIKNADIGVGMGITGTDVTKNVADMVLTDDNFATIVSAVEEGRRIYDNIRRAIQFLLASNLSEVLSIFIATMLGFTILKPVHLLWINLVTDCFPALALGVEKGEKDLMNRSPRNAKDGIFSGGLGFDVAYQGFLSSVLVLAAYLVGHYMESGRWEFVNSPDGMTMAFLTMSMMEIFHSLNMRSQRGSLLGVRTSNPLLFGAMGLSLVLVTLIIYVPALANLFSLEAISLTEYGVSIGIGFLIIPLVELVKLIQRLARKK